MVKFPKMFGNSDIHLIIVFICSLVTHCFLQIYTLTKEVKIVQKKDAK